MYDPVYKGWGNRTWLKGLVKGAFAQARLSSDVAGLQPTARSVSDELKILGLDTHDGVNSFAASVAEDILKSLKPDLVDIENLYFHKHLQAHIASFLLQEGLFELPEGLASESTSTRSELWQSEAKLQRIYHILINFDSVIGDVAQMFQWFVSPIIEQFPQLLETSPVQSDNLHFTVDVPHMFRDLPQAIERMVTLPFAPEFDELGHALKAVTS